MDEPLRPVDRLLKALEDGPLTALEIAERLGYRTPAVYDTISQARRYGHRIACRPQAEGMSTFEVVEK